MESVKRARKIMTFLVIVPICFCLFSILGYFLEGKGDMLALPGVWAVCSGFMLSTAEGAIKTLEQEIKSLKAGGSADTSDPAPPADEPATDE
jgi:hypothetical protein